MPNSESEGAADKAKGKIRNAIGGIKDAVRAGKINFEVTYLREDQLSEPKELTGPSLVSARLCPPR
jgi:hypothetical protein